MLPADVSKGSSGLAQVACKFLVLGLWRESDLYSGTSTQRLAKADAGMETQSVDESSWGPLAGQAGRGARKIWGMSSP